MIAIGIILIVKNQAIAYDEYVIRQKLKDIQAMEAVAFANELKWNSGDIKSYVTAHEVVFKFSDGTLKRIPLPKERMLVAVAPYMTRTHQ